MAIYPLAALTRIFNETSLPKPTGRCLAAFRRRPRSRYPSCNDTDEVKSLR